MSQSLGLEQRLRILVSDSQAKQIIDDILNIIGAGSAYDGKIFVYDVTEVYDIGTKKSGDSAI